MAIDELTYPQPVANRQGPAPGGAALAAAAAPPPRTRNINFKITINPTTRSTVSYGPFRGPAIVESMDIQYAGGAALDDMFCFLGYAPLPVTESLVAPTTGVSWSTFWELAAHAGADFAAGTRGAHAGRGLTVVAPHAYPVKGIVTLPEWYLVMSVGQTAGAAGNQFAGYVTVIEGVSPAALANFR